VLQHATYPKFFHVPVGVGGWPWATKTETLRSSASLPVFRSRLKTELLPRLTAALTNKRAEQHRRLLYVYQQLLTEASCCDAETSATLSGRVTLPRRRVQLLQSRSTRSASARLYVVSHHTGDTLGPLSGPSDDLNEDAVTTPDVSKGVSIFARLHLRMVCEETDLLVE